MKRFVLDFLRRGLVAAGIGPVVLAGIYWVLNRTAGLESLSVAQVCTGILSISLLSFFAGGMNAVYHTERLPLMAGFLLHGAVLYFGYLATYLLNDWLAAGWLPLAVFTVIFVLGYLIIWAVIYLLVKKRAAKLNRLMEQKRREE